MKQKRLTDNQSELVATFLPKKLRQNRKLNASVKLVLANIYQLYYFDNNIGKRTVFRTREDFMRDIGAKDKNEIQRPHAVLIQNELVYIKIGVRGRATEYTLNDDLYQLLPKQIRGEVSEKFKETHKSNTLKTNDLQKAELDIISPSHNKLNDSELQHSFVPSDTDTETNTKTNTIMVHEADVTTGEVETISADLDEASAYKQSSSFSIFEEDLASAHKPISADEIEHLPWEVVDEVKPISGEVKPISADTSTLSGPCSKADVISTSLNEDLPTADRLTYPQCLDDALTPKVPLNPLSHEKQETNPQVEEFIKRVKQAIRKGVYDWSLTLDDMPDYLTGDDVNSVVAPALRSQADVNDFLGLFHISDLSSFAQDLMENRLKNKDIPTIIRHNRIEKLHSKTRSNEDDVNEVEIGEAPDKQINQNSTAETSTKNDDVVDDDLPF